MKTVTIKDEFIKLGQVMKLAGLVDSGVDAKIVIQDGLVKVNGEIDTRRGRKIVAGDIVEYEGNKIKVESLL
ncbi:MAG: RNA-binding S4 domain-containing protein [Lachnospiraceae bacterium]|nr:RNA-binding S4 domain-containing protein [Lachnospiraceae bacterium]